jgi:SAM-dependent methyltransferase
VALVAPVVFDEYLELPLGIGLAVILGAVLAFQVRSRGTVLRIIGTSSAAIVVSMFLNPNAQGNRFEQRNFYGALRVQDQGSVETAYRSLYNGTVLHGLQWLAPTRSRWTTTYYGPDSAVGRLLDPQGRGQMRVGVIGLGVGTVAAYAQPGDYFRFYEINPLVIRVARNDFRYLAECRGRVDVVEGDARLSLEREAPENFDVLIVDAFSGDSIPVHLLTREAFETYCRHLAPGGSIAIHITNRYVDLAGLLGATARALGADAVVVTSNADVDRKTSFAKWAVLGTSGGSIERARGAADPNPLHARLRVWTDDFHNLFQVLE